MDGATQGEESRRQDFFPVGGVLVAQNTQHGVEVTVSPFHGIGLWVVGRREGELNVSSLEGLLHRLRPEVSSVVCMDL